VTGFGLGETREGLLPEYLKHQDKLLSLIAIQITSLPWVGNPRRKLTRQFRVAHQAVSSLEEPRCPCIELRAVLDGLTIRDCRRAV
jgi:hypothetical protein